MSEWDRQTSPGGVQGPQWVSAAEAADVAGVTPGTVRYWARNGLIVSEVVEGPAGEKTLVRLDEVLQHARAEAPTRGPGAQQAPPAPSSEVVTDLPARTSELAPILQSIPEIMAQLTAATDRAARAETKVEFLSAQLADLRQRLAETEAGGREAAATIVVPEAWERSEDPAATIAEEIPDPAPEATVWPAPPAEELHESDASEAEPAEVAEPGPETIDWTSRDSSAADDDDDVAAEEAPAATGPGDDAPLSLDDIWNQPAVPAATPAVEQVAEPGPGDVDWHEPAGSTSAPPPPPHDRPSTRPANAPVPDGDDFYGPRRRRWFRRKK